MDKQIISQLKKYSIKIYKDCFIIDSFIEGRKASRWSKESAQLQAISETVDFLWIQVRDYKAGPQVQEKTLMVNQIQGIEHLLDPDQFQKLFQSIRDILPDNFRMGNFMLESYTIPKNFIELENDMNRRDHVNYYKNQMSNWIVNKGAGTVIEIIPRTSKDTLLDYYHYKKHFPCRVSRNICKPFYFMKKIASNPEEYSNLQSSQNTPELVHKKGEGLEIQKVQPEQKFTIKISLTVWINSTIDNAFESYVFNEPRVSLQVEPLIQNCKGNLNGFLDFKGLLRYIQLHCYRLQQMTNLDEQANNMLKNMMDIVFISLTQIIPYLKKNPKFSQLLDFQFTLDESLKVYLYKIKDYMKLDCSDKKFFNEWKTVLMKDIFKKIEEKLKHMRLNKMVLPGIVKNGAKEGEDEENKNSMSLEKIDDSFGSFDDDKMLNEQFDTSPRKKERHNSIIQEPMLEPQEEKGINADILRFFSTTKKSLPTFYYYKQRNLPLMHFLFSSKRMLEIRKAKDQEERNNMTTSNNDSREYDANNDRETTQLQKLEEYLMKSEKFEEQKQRFLLIKELNKLFGKDLYKNAASELQDILMGKADDEFKKLDGRDVKKKAEVAFEDAFKSRQQHKVYNLDYFLDKSSYFNKSKEQVQALYKAIKDPQKFQVQLESMGLTENKFEYKAKPNPSNVNPATAIRRASLLNPLEQQMRKMLEQQRAKDKMNMLISDIDKGPELPEIRTSRGSSKGGLNKKGGLTKNKSMGRLLQNASFMRPDNLQDVAIDPRKFAEKINFQSFIDQVSRNESRDGFTSKTRATNERFIELIQRIDTVYDQFTQQSPKKKTPKRNEYGLKSPRYSKFGKTLPPLNTDPSILGTPGKHIQSPMLSPALKKQSSFLERINSQRGNYKSQSILEPASASNPFKIKTKIIEQPTISKWEDESGFIKEEDQKDESTIIDPFKISSKPPIEQSPKNKKHISFNNQVQVLDSDQDGEYSPRVRLQLTIDTKKVQETPLKLKRPILREMKEMIEDLKKAKLIQLIPFNVESKRLVQILQKVSMEVDSDGFINTYVQLVEECRRNYDFKRLNRRFQY
ncbi:UNKNOWN [Stylonychia lemnae]|uniref:Uncharacterized protein n=1 Tax=Stylonychia lemnae TaxID=5949 RepID=A0A078A309_STYLE|nr:UNKNOWN [Stylonychia lemnae]|eukprot:CDW76547.1 UNKNOWN [Stylonychia lemnae]